MGSPTADLRFDTLVIALAGRERAGQEFGRWCRLVDALEAALPAREVARAHRMAA